MAEEHHPAAFALDDSCTQQKPDFSNSRMRVVFPKPGPPEMIILSSESIALANMVKAYITPFAENKKNVLLQSLLAG
jgi:hypothetical protein